MNFDDILTFVKTNWIYVSIMGGFVILFIVAQIIMNKKNNAKVGKYLEQYPNSAKVYMSYRVGITTESMNIILVDGQEPCKFAKGGKGGVYVKPGHSALCVNYTYQRPGVMYKTVSKTTGAVDVKIEVEANKSYELGFDRKTEEFTFVENEE